MRKNIIIGLYLCCTVLFCNNIWANNPPDCSTPDAHSIIIFDSIGNPIGDTLEGPTPTIILQEGSFPIYVWANMWADQWNEEFERWEVFNISEDWGTCNEPTVSWGVTGSATIDPWGSTDADITFYEYGFYQISGTFSGWSGCDGVCGTTIPGAQVISQTYVIDFKIQRSYTYTGGMKVIDRFFGKVGAIVGHGKTLERYNDCSYTDSSSTYTWTSIPGYFSGTGFSKSFVPTSEEEIYVGLEWDGFAHRFRAATVYAVSIGDKTEYDYGVYLVSKNGLYVPDYLLKYRRLAIDWALSNSLDGYYDGPADASRHGYLLAMFASHFGYSDAIGCGRSHEHDNPPTDPESRTAMDIYNNYKGAAIGVSNPGLKYYWNLNLFDEESAEPILNSMKTSVLNEVQNGSMYIIDWKDCTLLSSNDIEGLSTEKLQQPEF